MSENLGIDTDNNDTGYIGEDTWTLDFHIYLEKGVTGTT